MMEEKQMKYFWLTLVSPIIFCNTYSQGGGYHPCVYLKMKPPIHVIGTKV